MIARWNRLQYIYTFQRDTQCRSTECLLMHRCQLYMFRTVTVHPQELLFRCCMCRLWYVVRTALSDTSRWHLCINKHSVLQHCVSRWNVYILQKNDTRTFQCQVKSFVTIFYQQGTQKLTPQCGKCFNYVAECGKAAGQQYNDVWTGIIGAENKGSIMYALVTFYERNSYLISAQIPMRLHKSESFVRT